MALKTARVSEPHPMPLAGPRALRSLLACTGLLMSALGATPAHAEPEWFMQTGGVSHHFRETQAVNRQWHEEHPGLGFERRTINEYGWQERWNGGVMQDSRGIWGGYVGNAYLYRWRQSSVAEFGVGAGVYAFYRSTSWRGDMTVVPGVLPTMSMGLFDNRVGLNVIYVPRLPAVKDNMPGVILAQLLVSLP